MVGALNHNAAALEAISRHPAMAKRRGPHAKAGDDRQTWWIAAARSSISYL
jgi:hypothetical protein